MDSAVETETQGEAEGAPNPSNGNEEEKAKVVVIMGPTGSGKSRLAIDLATHFPIEIINADSMQVYHGLDVLTNKVSLNEQKGVPHHLLGTISPNLEFTAKDFRDSVIPLINDILLRNCMPVIVGGTNYYIQALVSAFLLDDSAEDMDEGCLSGPLGDEQTDKELDFGRDGSDYSYDHLKDIDPVAANRIHPNNHRKISQYLNLYSRSGVPPSKLFQEKTAKNWGQVNNFRYNCCFICVDASLPVLDQYVEQRVDCMIEAGLLNEVFDIYNPNADYTRGLRQAIGVREFENFLKDYFLEGRCDEESDSTEGSLSLRSINKGNKMLKENIQVILDTIGDNQPRILLKEAIDRMKLNTRRLVRRQKRGINRLQTLFGWNIHYVDATESISCKSDDSWALQVVEPAEKIIRSFLNENASSMPDLEAPNNMGPKLIQRDLWTQYICQACGDRVLRGVHEWEQHKQGRGHRKRISRLRKSQGFYLLEQQQQQQQHQHQHPDCS
ncbi:LOW QUALITY PROTEIN: tRNA dimethylallyltransferase 2-like [Quercus lobata]|uniref:LOW QUALITY PROTEIN: tRNA dimethylallyltransferase 2-like n=1 Tax=Quercus lobata TaxID=97700 RepID=UPI00124412BE|nr:LOW QUALITY PROTEIN: tRNA dimethylallyltransferase 2-like [Quercus lobata]